MRRNILFAACLEKLNFSFYFGNEKFVMYKDDDVVLNELRNSDMYQVQISENIICEVSEASLTHYNSLYLWHLRLGHIGRDKIYRFTRTSLIMKLTRKNSLHVKVVYMKK